MTNDKALEAAWAEFTSTRSALALHGVKDVHAMERDTLSTVISAYLSALPGEAEVSGYLFRLRYGQDRWSHQLMFSDTLPKEGDAKEIEPLVTLASFQAMQARAEAAEIENDRLIADAQAAWSKHGGTEIALGQWKARAEAAERERDEALRLAGEDVDALQAIGEEFGIEPGEHRVTGVRRLLTEYRARVKELEEALKPFSTLSTHYIVNGGSPVFAESENGRVKMPKAWFRRARTALAGGSNG